MTLSPGLFRSMRTEWPVTPGRGLTRGNANVVQEFEQEFFIRRPRLTLGYKPSITSPDQQSYQQKQAVECATNSGNHDDKPAPVGCLRILKTSHHIRSRFWLFFSYVAHTKQRKRRNKWRHKRNRHRENAQQSAITRHIRICNELVDPGYEIWKSQCEDPNDCGGDQTD